MARAPGRSGGGGVGADRARRPVAADACRRAAGQYAGDAAVDGGGRARRIRAVRDQHDAPRRRPGRRHQAVRLPAGARRRRAHAAARRPRSGRCHRARRRRARLPRGGRGGGTACAASRSRRRGHRRDDLHVGHQRRPEGGAVRPRDGGDVRRQPGRAVRAHGRRRVLPVDAAVPLQRGGGGLGGGDGVRRDDGAREVLAVAVPARHPPVRRHVHELRRQAAGTGAGHARAARRRRQHAAGGVRQRGHRARHRRVRAAIRVPRRGQLRLQRVRRRRDARGRHARRDRSARDIRVSACTTPTP